MAIYAEQLPSGKWGIYSKVKETATLIATVACKATCATIMANLKSGRRDAPDSDTNQLYQVPQLKDQSQNSPKGTLPAVGSRRQRTAVSPRKPRKRNPKKVIPALNFDANQQGRTLTAANAVSATNNSIAYPVAKRA